ncbi:TPA: hypothetical protein ACIVB1_001517 [Salmonella enterica subsp. diarizonae serovar 61:l,v:z35]
MSRYHRLVCTSQNGILGVIYHAGMYGATAVVVLSKSQRQSQR